MRAVVFAYSNVGDRCLRVLHARGVEVALVVTHRDTPGETLWFRRVADTAAELSLPTVLVEDLSAAELEQSHALCRILLWRTFRVPRRSPSLASSCRRRPPARWA
jgi:methionyl-tRNA formyltransferase